MSDLKSKDKSKEKDSDNDTPEITQELIKVTVELLLKRVHPSWKPILYGKETKELLDEVVNDLLVKDITMKEFTPNPADIFNFAKHDISNAKVVLIGQDPYHQKDVAHGYCFSTQDMKLPASLRKIFKALKLAEMTDTLYPSLYALNNWARQGMILMNTALTTKLHVANAHQNIWANYTDQVIELIAEHVGRTLLNSKDEIKTNPTKKLTWFLWGNFAQSKSKFINRGEKKLGIPNSERVNLILKICHPVAMGKLNFITESQDGWLSIKNRYPDLWWNPSGHIGYTDGASKNNQMPRKARAAHGYHFTGGPFKNVSGGGAVRKKVIYLDKAPSKDPYIKSNSHKDIINENYDTTLGSDSTITGSSSNNTARSTSYVPKKGKDHKHKVVFWPSNIRAEGYAILNLLKYVLNSQVYMSVIIYTDSKFWIDHITTRIPKIANNVKEGKDEWENHKNHDLVKEMWEIRQKFRSLKCPIILEYCPAHHDCKAEFIKDQKSLNYQNYMGNKKAEELAEACLDEEKEEN